MGKKYGLLSLVFGCVSILGAPLMFPPFLAVLFAVLYKAKGNPADKKQHRYARIGAIMGSLALGMVFGAWFLVLFPGEGVLHGFLLVLIYLVTLVLPVALRAELEQARGQGQPCPGENRARSPVCSRAELHR